MPVHECGGKQFPYIVPRRSAENLYQEIMPEYGTQLCGPSLGPIDPPDVIINYMEDENDAAMSVMKKNLRGDWDFNANGDFVFEYEIDAQWFAQWASSIKRIMCRH